jgi:hypothetical protein
MSTPNQPSDFNPDQQIPPPPPPPAPYGGTINTGPDAIPPTQPAAMPPMSAYPPGYQPPAAPNPPPASAAPRLGRPIGAIVSIVAVIVIVAAVGLGVLAGKNGSGPLAAIFATPVPAATNTPVPPTATTAPTASPTSALPTAMPGFQNFPAQDGSYVIEYPTNWAALPTTQQTTAGTGTVTATVFVSPDQQNFALVASNGQEIPSSAYITAIEAIVQAVGQSVSNVHVTSGPSQVQAGNYTWTNVTATLTFQGKPYMASIYGTDHNNATTFFVELAPAATFSTTNTATFMPMLDSFMFLK